MAKIGVLAASRPMIWKPAPHESPSADEDLNHLMVEQAHVADTA